MEEYYTEEEEEAPKRASQVCIEVQRLTHIVAAIDKQMTELKDRLNDIVIGEPPQVADSKNEPMPDNLVPLAVRIREQRLRLERVDSNMNKLMQRIEL